MPVPQVLMAAVDRNGGASPPSLPAVTLFHTALGKIYDDASRSPQCWWSCVWAADGYLDTYDLEKLLLVARQARQAAAHKVCESEGETSSVAVHTKESQETIHGI